MIVSTSLLILALLGVSSAQYTPTFAITCTADSSGMPVYTVAITAGGSTTGIIFVDNACVAQTTAATGSYVFQTSTCTTVPAFGSTFKLVMQELATINLSTDKIVDVTCTASATTTGTAVITSTGSVTADETNDPSLTPPFTIDIQDATSTVITVGNVGDNAKVSITIDSAYSTIFGFTVTDVTVSDGTITTPLITSGCSVATQIFANPAVGPTDGTALELAFPLFIIINTGTPTTVPTTATSLTFTFTLGLCELSNGVCPTAATCVKRKRRSDIPLNTTEVEVRTVLTVYPKGYHISDKSSASDNAINADDVCLATTPFFGLIFSLVVVMLLCMLVTVWMFCRLRRPTTKDDRQYENAGFRAK